MTELDLHVHSKYSFDSFLDAKTILKVARKKGLDSVAIVDHNTLRGALEARNIRNSPIKVIVGSEISTSAGDVIGLFLTEEISASDVFSVIEQIKSQGGLCVLPHPMKHQKLSVDMFKRVCEKVDVIEGFNSRFWMNSEILNFVKSLRKPLVAGSDAHFACEIGLARTRIENGASETEDIEKNILQGNVQILGTHSPVFLQAYSQVIKSVKTRKYLDLPTSMAMLMIYFPINVLSRQFHFESGVHDARFSV